MPYEIDDFSLYFDTILSVRVNNALAPDEGLSTMKSLTAHNKRIAGESFALVAPIQNTSSVRVQSNMKFSTIH